MKKRRPKIVVVGSINMDLVLRCEHLPLPGETIAANQCVEVSGGKGANQAVAAAKMGADVEIIGRVGNDVFGPQLLRCLTEAGVGTQYVKACEDCGSGLALVMVERSGQNSIVIVPAANGQLSRLDIREVASVIGAADMLLVQLECPLEAVDEAIAIAQAAGVKVLLNPAPASKSLPNRFYEVDIICPNQTEAELLTGVLVDSYATATTAAKMLLDRGAAKVVITLGKDGACVAERNDNRDEFTSVASRQVTAVDTTAAGDAFIGALATYLSEYQELGLACRKACIAGALATTKLGAQTSLPWRAEVEAFR
jgi:ribokinase